MDNGGLPDGPVELFNVVIVGAGPGRLAVSQQLSARSISHTVLERGDHPAWMWGHVYDSLRLHTGKQLSSLPGMPFPAETSLSPTRSEFTSYLHEYAAGFQLPVRAGIEAAGLRQENGKWMGEYGARNECGFALRQVRVQSSIHPNLFFVGHNYDGRGGLYNIRIDTRRIGRQVAKTLGRVKAHKASASTMWNQMGMVRLNHHNSGRSTMVST